MSIEEFQSKELETALFAAELRSDLPSLDLHGLFPDQIGVRIDQFLYDNPDERVIAIIHGAGTGKLKQETLRVLKNHPFVEFVKEKSGYCLVVKYLG